jgi:iron complex outermembrane recepter protein
MTRQTVVAMLLASVALSSLAMPSLAQTAAGQAAGEEQFEDIIITARRQDERLQDVPATVSVLTADTLAKAGVTDTASAIQLTPGVTVVTGTAEAGDTQINIRGINGARDAESSVALVVDGILKTNTAQLNADQGDLSQLEILKGPQGALYGRNAAAGAIVMTTRKPGDRLEARARASYGNNETYALFGSISAPIAEGLGILVSGDYRSTDGFYRNTGPIPATRGATVDASEAWNLNGRLLYEGDNGLNIDVKAKYGKVDANSIAFNAVFALPNFAALNPDFNKNVNEHEFQFYPNILPFNNQEFKEASVKVDYDFGAMKLTAWALYSDVDQDFGADGTSGAFGFFNNEPSCRASTAQLNAAGFRLPSPQFLGQVPDSNLFVPNGSLLGPYTPTTCDGTQYQVRNQRDFSTEIRLASNSDGPLNWLVGVYYLNIDREVGVNLGVDRGQGIIPDLFTTNAANPTVQLVHDNFKTDVYAVFGSVDFKATDRFTANLALRYDREERSVINLVPTTARQTAINTCGTGGAQPLNPALCGRTSVPDQDEAFSQLQPKVSLSFKATDDINLFANWGIGFKSGGFNNVGSQATLAQNFNPILIANGARPLTITDQFRKERSSAFEAGLKGQFADGRVNIELAGYYTDVKDMQFFEFFVGTFGLLRVVSNIDKVTLKGLEASANVKVIDGWSVFGAFNVTDSEIKEYGARPDTVGNKSPYTANYTLNLGTQLVAPITDSMDIVLRADYRHTGPTWFHAMQENSRPTLFNFLLPLAGLPAALGTADYSLTRRDAFGILNARVGLQGDNWTLTAWAENLLDKKNLAEVIPAPEFGGSFLSPGGRRAYGIEATFKF